MEGYLEGKSKYIEKVIILAIVMIIIATIMNVGLVHADNSSHIVMDIESGRVLSGDNVDKRLPMASTTKVMTALIAIESGKLDDKITITHEMTCIEGSSIYLKVGEVLTLEELLYGLMLRSGNDAATAIAIGVGGSIESFVGMMNRKAESLGISNTHFVNPHGLHDDEHYTSARDLATIACTAMRNDKFKEIVSTKSKIIGGETSEKRYLVNKNKLLSMYKNATGIKTGFTKRAGRCLVSSASNYNMDIVSVVLNEPDMWHYSISSMDKAFRDYTAIDLVTAHSKICDVTIGSRKYGICTHNTIKYPLTDDEARTLSYDIDIDTATKNIKSGQNVGKILVYRDKHLIFEEKIYTI